VKDDRLYLIHLGECIGRIERYTTEGKAAFLRDEKTQDAVLRNLQTLAESTQRLSELTKGRRPQIDWRAIAGFRNVLVHDYLGLNVARVWEIIDRDLPALKKAAEELLQELGGIEGS
jgi:uncharacterized protein with HEPN domain